MLIINMIFLKLHLTIEGSNMVFYALASAGPPREMLKPEPERRGFQPLLRGPADVNVSEKHV